MTITFNVRTLGVNRDNILRDAQLVNARYLLVQDDPALAWMARDAGMRVVYRQTGDDTIDGNDPVAFVRERAKNSPPDALIHLTNEIDYSKALSDWTFRAMQECYILNRRAVILNYSTHRSRTQWSNSQSLISTAKAMGHVIGLHVYVNGTQDADAYRWQEFQTRYGGDWFVTEWAYIKDVRDADRGWRGTIGAAEYAQFIRDHMTLYRDLDMQAFLFSYEHWRPNDVGYANGFGVFDAPEVMEAMKAMNDYSATPTAGTGCRVALQGAPTRIRSVRTTVGNAPIATVPVGAELVWYPETDDGELWAGHRWVWVKYGRVEGWMALVQKDWKTQFQA